MRNQAKTIARASTSIWQAHDHINKNVNKNKKKRYTTKVWSTTTTTTTTMTTSEMATKVTTWIVFVVFKFGFGHYFRGLDGFLVSNWWGVMETEYSASFKNGRIEPPHWALIREIILVRAFRLKPPWWGGFAVTLRTPHPRTFCYLAILIAMRFAAPPLFFSMKPPIHPLIPHHPIPIALPWWLWLSGGTRRECASAFGLTRYLLLMEEELRSSQRFPTNE